MTELSDDTIAAYVDGELSDAQRQQIESALAADASVASRIARYRALRDRLRAAYDATLHEPVPDRLLQTLQSAPPPPAGELIDLAQVRALRLQRAQRAARRPLTARWSTMAAAVVVGICAALLWQRLPTRGGNLLSSNGETLARGALASALNQQLASEPSSGAIRVGLSFRSNRGGYCRTFVINEAQARAGLACRDQDEWRVVRILDVAPAADGTQAYRMASSALPAPLLQAMNERMSGEALDAQAERAARDQGWR